MPKKIYIINSGTEFRVAKGELSKHFVQTAQETLEKKDYELKVTHIAEGYNIQNELDNILWADVIIYQIPVFWMSYPWILKKYIDEVASFGSDTLYASDGRTRSDPAKKYGTGGLVKDKHYMISTTWNAPLEAFTDKDQFFEGVGIDGVFFHFHKAHQFMGFKALPTFLCCDIYKNPQIEADTQRFIEHLHNHI